MSQSLLNVSTTADLQAMVDNHLNSTLTSGDYDIASNQKYSIPFWVFLFIQTFITITGNSMLCWLFMSHKSLRSTQNYFVVSLSIADLLVGLTVPPCEYCAVKATSECQLLCGSAVSFNMCASTVNLVLIASDRYCSIKYPFRYRELMRQRHVYIAIVIGWIVCFMLIATPFTWVLSHNISAKTKERLGLIYSGIMFSAVILVGLLLGICYYIIVAEAREKLRVNNEQPSNPVGIKVCVIVAISFFLCWIPQCVVEIALQFKANIPQVVSNCAYFIMLTNPCLDPVLYAYYRRDFRRELGRWIQRRSYSVRRIKNCLRSGRTEVTITTNVGTENNVGFKETTVNARGIVALHASTATEKQVTRSQSSNMTTEI